MHMLATNIGICPKQEDGWIRLPSFEWTCMGGHFRMQSKLFKTMQNSVSAAAIKKTFQPLYGNSDEGFVVDGKKKGNIGRFFNAKESTNDVTVQCKCGAKNCRQRLR